MDIYHYDTALRRKGYAVIAGIDEAGRGPIAGPVVAAAVVLSDGLRIEGLRDSKEVPEKERTTLFHDILALAEDIGIGIVEHKEIDRLNILLATKMAMQQALQDLNIQPDMLVIDAVTLHAIPIRQYSPFRAESISASVAAASIVAKYVRDTIMLRYHDEYPNYKFNKHKGYGTRDHIELIRMYGPCPIHRKTFNKVMSLRLPF